MKKSYNFIAAVFLAAALIIAPKLAAQERAPYHLEPAEAYENSIGGTDMSFDMSKMDSAFPQMEHWIQAGVEGGVPSLKSEMKRVKARFTVKNFSEEALNAKIKEISEKGGGAILLKNGEYKFTTNIILQSNVTIVGESQDGVIVITDDTYDGSLGSIFYLNEVEYCGVRNLTMRGEWLNEDGKPYPKHPWNDRAIDELPEVKAVSVLITPSSENCYVDQLTIINCALHPIVAHGNHTTIRNCYVDGAYKKGGGCQGYLFLGGSYNLMTGCFVTHIRHIAIQTPRSFYNVVYDNLLYQEMSFHTADGGNNLIENNKFILPEDMPAKYYAIMGPWSIKHKVSAFPNFIYKNSCLENNHGGATPWSDDNILYEGPYVIKPADPSTNFGAREGALPKGETLYPVKL